MMRICRWGVRLVIFCGIVTVKSWAGVGDDAAALFEQGKFKEARELADKAKPADADYKQTLIYNALSRHELKDWPGTANKIEKLRALKAAIPSTLSEPLDFAYIDAAYHCRKFDAALPAISDYEKQHPQTPHAALLHELKMSSLFERGMKKSHEIADFMLTGDAAKFRKGISQEDLQSFLEMAMPESEANHTLFTKDELKEKIWKALILSGNEDALVKEIPVLNAADREKASFLRARIHSQYHPEDLETNVRLLAEFEKNFPSSTNVGRAKFDLVKFQYRLGAKFYDQASEAARANQATTATQFSSWSSTQFDRMRSKAEELAVDKANGIEPSDLRDVRQDIFNSYLIEKRFDRLFELIDVDLDKYPKNSLEWLDAKLYEGYGWRMMTPPDNPKAAAAMDVILALGLHNQLESDQLYASAARIRCYIYRENKEGDKADKLIDSIVNGKCAKKIKDQFKRD